MCIGISNNQIFFKKKWTKGLQNDWSENNTIKTITFNNVWCTSEKWLSVILKTQRHFGNLLAHFEIRVSVPMSLSSASTVCKRGVIIQTSNSYFICIHNIWIYIIKDANLIFTNHKIQIRVQIQSFWGSKVHIIGTVKLILVNAGLI